jgi:hypothetical protein
MAGLKRGLIVAEVKLTQVQGNPKQALVPAV